ncbi:MAG: ADP-dependent glucokinase/phosphofructokinase [Candidatus Aenigmarchaeota archaeon]|nr:ADP-dependent glucokinase/phosphofructokinase [Candidatus Aenigmarchaeota archaeon]
MKPFLGLFVCWDVVTRQEPPEFLRRFFIRKSDSEHYISRAFHSRISPYLGNPKRIIGGNAGIAAITLSELGIPCVLSCPSRPKSLMSELSKYRIFLFSGGKEKSPKSCSRTDPNPEHIIFEMDGYRKIFTHDEVQSNFLFDQDFWNSLKNANYLFLSGFHTVPKKHKKKTGQIADFLEKRKFKVHLEVGYGETMKYAAEKLIGRNCIDSIGMNDTELEVLGISEKDTGDVKEKLLSFLEKTSLERISLHSREYRLSVFKQNPERNFKAAEFSVQSCAAKALGGIKENMEKAKSVPSSGVKPSKGRDFLIIPTRIVENPKITVGLGDTAAVTDSFYALKS